MASHEVILPMHLLFLLRIHDVLLLRVCETMEDVENHQPDSWTYHRRSHHAVRHTCVVAFGRTERGKHQGVQHHGHRGERHHDGL